MRTRTTWTRTALAVATLAALPIFTGAVQSDADPAAATRSVAEHAPGPQWSYIVGEDLAGPLMLGCPSAGWSCAIYTL